MPYNKAMIDRVIAQWIVGVRFVNRQGLTKQLLLFLFFYVIYCAMEPISKAAGLILVITLAGFVFPWFFGLIEERSRQ